jgi:hypothetical protein
MRLNLSELVINGKSTKHNYSIVKACSNSLTDGDIMPIEVHILVLCVYSTHPAVAAQAQARIKILEKLPDLEPPEEEDTESFK